MNHKIKKIFFLLASGFYVMAQEGDFQEFKYQTKAGKELPYVVYQPKNIDPKVKRPLIVYLHGAVSRPMTSKDPVASSKKAVISKLAEEMNCYVLYPYGQKDATWFDKVGVEMVLSELSETQKKYNVDSNKIFLSGFSDGASGTLYFATTQSTPFAGFIALNGALPVAANLGFSPVYLENLNRKPLYIVNTQSDMLYPAKGMQPVIDKIKEYHSSVIYRTPQGNHETSYFPTLKEEIKNFIQNNERKIGNEISFEVSDDFSSSFHWLKITKLNKDEKHKIWHQPYQLKLTNDKASFGLIPDTKHQGESMKVAGFGKNSMAKEMGVQVGDLILKMENTEMKGPMSSFTYIAGKKAGDFTSLTILREGKEIVLQGKFPPPYDYEVFEKKPFSGKVKAKLEGKILYVETSGVSEFEINFDDFPFKKGRKINMILNNGTPQKIKVKGVQKFSVF